jgi:hypothetical protein
MEVRVPYAGGVAKAYNTGLPINLGNGDMTATLQADTINPAGGFLVYRVQGTPASSDKIILPVNFGGKNCQVEIFIYEPNVGQFNFLLLTFNDLDKDCVKDSNENQENIPAKGMFMKIFDLNDNLLFVKEINEGQFDVNDFPGYRDVIYYYIIDDNNLATDKEPSLPVGWNSGMSAPNLKRYFHYDGNLYFQNTDAVTNLLDPTWDGGVLPWMICLNQDPGTIAALDCANPTLSGSLIKDQLVVGTEFTISYTGGNGGYYATQSIASTGVTGLTATLTKGSFEVGSGDLTWMISGTPTAGGTVMFSIVIGGQTCQVSLKVDAPSMSITQVLDKDKYELKGEVLTYTITVTNTGNVALTNVKIVDSLTGFSTTIPLL